MNIKLLKELYKQAETECGWSEEKFAELIVRECLDILDDEDDGSTDTKSVRIAAYCIKKNFGVE